MSNKSMRLIGKVLVIVIVFYLSSILIGYLEGTGITVTYKDIVMTKPRRINLSEFPGSEAVFISGTCYSRIPFNGTMVFPEPPMVDGNISCSLELNKGGYVCSGTGYVYMWNFTCTDVITRDHPVSRHYYLGVPGDPIVVAMINSSLANAVIVIGFLLSLLFGSKTYSYGKQYFILLFFSPIMSYMVAYSKAFEMDIMRNILREKSIYLLISMYVGLLVSPLIKPIARSLRERIRK